MKPSSSIASVAVGFFVGLFIFFVLAGGLTLFMIAQLNVTVKNSPTPSVGIGLVLGLLVGFVVAIIAAVYGGIAVSAAVAIRGAASKTPLKVGPILLGVCIGLLVIPLYFGIKVAQEGRNLDAEQEARHKSPQVLTFQQTFDMLAYPGSVLDQRHSMPDVAGRPRWAKIVLKPPSVTTYEQLKSYYEPMCHDRAENETGWKGVTLRPGDRIGATVFLLRNMGDGAPGIRIDTN